MQKGNSKPLTPELAVELRALEAMPDAEIDTSDIPLTRNWAGAARGKFYRPVKRQITLRLDADLLDFFEAQGKGYQTRINAALRDWVATHPPAPADKPG
jgi:uncharacterized protein (DUF4415 family)